ncbi:hypothetical protein E4U38_006515 [Claviceps purpurea]|nr:hypothetical protein E4U38_006515 [Claviceps purpurea]KAG6176925.1 hypothetical protein E4U27_004726 [Claviceps purpurea]KAG6251913.1 hypothetical protein E4U23_000169 [Claviceps purpurea]KAG6262955.1 hypothetical protein E4U49_002711 [Claviceps purpurea]KAG6307847.1 hypothetical protein E4U45_003334 [Claviceps purpurea]
MAMDALRNLADNIPDWQRRLDDLNGQIQHRQAELAALAGSAVQPATSLPSLRNKGSSESLKPKNEGPVHSPIHSPIHCDPESASISRQHRPKRHLPPRTPSAHSKEAHRPVSPPPFGSDGQAALHQQARDPAASKNCALAQANKKRRPSSVMTAENVDAARRTRSMIIVYYDSYVQRFFDDLVRFVSSSRNLMRKAKMAAKVAQIKRMAELEVANEATRSDIERPGADALPSLKYISPSRPEPVPQDQASVEARQPGQSDEPVDVYDSLDKSLEFVQSTCEHSAHQFLRHADCYDEIRKIQARLVKVLQESREELERVQRETPELVKEAGHTGKARMRRSISVRRDATAEQKEGSVTEADQRFSSDIAPLDTPEASAMLEIDPDVDEQMGEFKPPLQYRSTRLMRSGAV